MIAVTKSNLTGIDVMKLIAAVMIVLLHTVETTAWYPCEIKFVFTRWAVPFFFITSGFFLYKGLEKALDIKRYILFYEKRLLKLFCIWNIICLPFEISTYVTKYPDASFLKLCLLLIRRLFIIGAGPYWYLLALIISSGFIYWCFHHNREALIIACIVIGFILQIEYTCLRGFFNTVPFIKALNDWIYFIWSWEFNFLMYGIPFVGMGYFIARNNFKINHRISILVFMVATILRIVEYNLPLLIPCDFWENNIFSVFYIVQAVSIFMFAKEIDVNITDNLSLKIRQLSTCIYLSHVIILYDILNPVLIKFTKLPLYDGMMIMPKVVIVLLICCLLFVLIKKINNKYLNMLITG